MSTFELVMTVALVVYSISLHELAHAWTATWCGDPTPGRHGRLTWNPVVQLDPFYSMLLPIMSYALGGWPIGFAYTPVDPSRFRRPLRDSALVGLAGPLANILFAAIFIGMLWIPGWAEPPKQNCVVFTMTAYWCLLLAVFNLLPIPGLDGYDIIRPALPLSVRTPLDRVRRSPFVPMILIFAVGPALLPAVWGPVQNLFGNAIPHDSIIYVQSVLKKQF